MFKNKGFCGWTVAGATSYCFSNGLFFMNPRLSQCSTYPEIVPLSALIACNGMNSPGGAALSFSHKFHHWLMLYTLAEYIVNMQSSMTSDRFLTILTLGIQQWLHEEHTTVEMHSPTSMVTALVSSNYKLAPHVATVKSELRIHLNPAVNSACMHWIEINIAYYIEFRS